MATRTFSSHSRLFLRLFLLLLCCLALNAMGYARQWNVSPTEAPLFISIATLPLSMPLALVSLFAGFVSPGGTFLTIVLPWCAVAGALLTLLLITRRVVFFALLSLLMLPSSWYWGVVAMGLMGI